MSLDGNVIYNDFLACMHFLIALCISRMVGHPIYLVIPSDVASI